MFCLLDLWLNYILIISGIPIKTELEWAEFHIQTQICEELLKHKIWNQNWKSCRNVTASFKNKQKVAQLQLPIIVIFKSYHLSSSYSMPGNMVRVLHVSFHLNPHHSPVRWRSRFPFLRWSNWGLEFKGPAQGPRSPSTGFKVKLSTYVAWEFVTSHHLNEIGQVEA